MRRFLVGLLATIGAVALLSIAGLTIFALTVLPTGNKDLPTSTVLSLDLRRMPSESGSGDLLGLWRGSHDMTETLELLWQAADDPRIVGLYVELGDESAGIARVQEMRDAIARFRSRGKFAIGFAEALGSGGDRFSDYYLASALDDIWLQPSGGFGVTGIAVETPFFKAGLDRLGIHVEGGKRYEYKSAPDSFTENGYSGPARENLQRLLDSLFGQFIADVARDRKIDPDQLRQLIDAAPFDSQRAKTERLIDNLGYRTDALDQVSRRARTRSMTSLEDYAAAGPTRRKSEGAIALVRATGAIVSGTTSDNPLDDESMAAADDVVDALDAASSDKDVKAIVFRIDSPGGTYPAADAIADGVARARATGKPVIVSMGDVAASGGYLAAVRADAIVAQPGTITASIGVFGMWPVAADLLKSLGIRFERLQAGANAGMYSTFQAPTAAQRSAVARELDYVYREFTRQVREARKLDTRSMDAAGRGRVFTGSDAKLAGLVDELGGLGTAIDLAKRRAGIEHGGGVELRRFPAENKGWQKLLSRAWRLAGLDSRGPELRAPRELREAMTRLGIASRPGNVRLPPLPPLWR